MLSLVRTRKNGIFDFLNSGGGSVKSVRLFRGGSSKVYFVDKGGRGGQKSPKMCVRLLWTPPNLQNQNNGLKLQTKIHTEKKSQVMLRIES